MITLVDVSNYQPKIRFLDLHKDVSGIYSRIGEGDTADVTFRGHRSGAKQVNMPFGPYYFAHPEHHTPSESVEYYLRFLKSPTGLRPVLDYEWGGRFQTEAWAREFCKGFRKEAGVYPFIYLSSSMLHIFSRTVGGGLWIANYSRNDGHDYPVVSVLPWKHYLLHQFTSRGHVQGIDGPVDVSHRRGTLAALGWEASVFPV